MTMKTEWITPSDNLLSTAYAMVSWMVSRGKRVISTRLEHVIDSEPRQITIRVEIEE